MLENSSVPSISAIAREAARSSFNAVFAPGLTALVSDGVGFFTIYFIPVQIIRGGQAHGATDDFGYRAIVDRTQTADLHATILHLLGLDHETLTFAHNSRDERLTDVYTANKIDALLA